MQLKTFTRTLLLAALTAVSGAFTACSDKGADPAPMDKAPAFQMINWFDYGANRGGTVHDYSQVTITGQSRLNSSALVLSFAAGKIAAYDSSSVNIHLAIARTHLNAFPLMNTWAGRYSIRDKNHPSAPVSVTYKHSTDGIASFLPISDTTPEVQGSVYITHYNPKTQLVSGFYTIEAAGQENPLKEWDSPTTKACTIKLTGKFQNLKVNR